MNERKRKSVGLENVKSQSAGQIQINKISYEAKACETQGSHGFYRQINHYPQFDIWYVAFYLDTIKMLLYRIWNCTVIVLFIWRSMTNTGVMALRSSNWEQDWGTWFNDPAEMNSFSHVRLVGYSRPRAPLRAWYSFGDSTQTQWGTRNADMHVTFDSLVVFCITSLYRIIFYRLFKMYFRPNNSDNFRGMDLLFVKMIKYYGSTILTEKYCKRRSAA